MSDSEKYSFKLAGQRILIFGGTGGVGLAVAEASIEAGATVILSSSREASLQTAITSILDNYPSAKARLSGFKCDLMASDVENRLVELFDQARELDHIVYLAGERIPTSPLDKLSLERTTKIHHTRAFVPILVAKVGSKQLKKSPASSMVLVSGSVAEKPIAGGWATLAAVGAGTCGLARQLAFDLAPIRVNAVAMGVTDTSLWADMPKETYNAFMKAQREKVLTGRVATPDDVAEAFLYCMKDKNVTGHVVHTSGGDLLI